MSTSLTRVSSLMALALPRAVPWLSMLPAARVARSTCFRCALLWMHRQAVRTDSRAPLAATSWSCANSQSAEPTKAPHLPPDYP